MNTKIGKIVDKRYYLIQPISSSLLGQTYLAEDTHRPGSPQCVIREIQLGNFSSKKSCPTLTLLPPNKGRLEVSKNVQYISVAQWAAKLHLVKLGVIFHKV